MPTFSVYQQHTDKTDKTDTEHTVTITRNENDKSKIDLYIDGYYIYSHNWKYLSSDRRHLEYSQPPQDHHKMLLSGRLTFKPGYLLGEGTMTFGQSKIPIQLAVYKSVYRIDTGGNNDEKLAYYDSNGDKLIWKNRDNEYWDKYEWNEGQYIYEYWFEQNESNEFVVRVTYKFTVTDEQATPANNTITVTEDEGITYYTVMSTTGAMPLEWPWPQKFKYEFEDEFAHIMNGGAMQLISLDAYGTVVAFKGISMNSCSVGTYSLQTAGKKSGVLVIHPKGLTINGHKADGLEITGNKASWKGSAKSGYMSQDGFIEFSECKKHVTCSSGATGISIAEA